MGTARKKENALGFPQGVFLFVGVDRPAACCDLEPENRGLFQVLSL